MKKSISEIFDAATAQELEKLVSENEPPELPEEALDKIKKKVLESEELAVGKKTKRAFKWRWKYALPAGAAVVLAIAIAIAALPIAPVWYGAHYSAEELAELVNGLYDSVSTNAYKEICVAGAEYLDIGDLSKKAFLDIYERQGDKKSDEKEFRKFIDDILTRLEKAISGGKAQYEVKERAPELEADGDIGGYHLSGRQDADEHRFSLSDLFDKNGKKIVLDGKTVQIDQRQSDEEIIKSLEWVRKRLCDIFGENFKDAKVSRSFNKYNENGAQTIYVYFYNESAHYLNKTQSYPVSDYILISFDNYDNGAKSTEVLSDSVLTDAHIIYRKLRTRVSTEYKTIAKAKTISLKKAEEYLYKGYVFGFHTCPICMEDQEKISFEGYDFVDIEYVFARDHKTNDETIGVPFYAFYKKLGTAKNGNEIYAKTYVAAIEIEGYEEYFEKQRESHPKDPVVVVE